MLSILGIGTAVPEHRMDQDQAFQITNEIACQTPQQSRLAQAHFYRRAGVNSRFTVLPHRNAVKLAKESAAEQGITDGPGPGPTTALAMEMYEDLAFPLALDAAQRALAEAGISPQQITHLITVSLPVSLAGSPRAAAAARLDCQVKRSVFMSASWAVTRYQRPTSGARTSGFAHTGHVLLAVELCSLHYRFQWDPERMLGNVLFADGAQPSFAGRHKAKTLVTASL